MKPVQVLVLCIGVCVRGGSCGSLAGKRVQPLRAIEAVTLTIKALWTAGIVDTLLGLIFAFTSDEFICAYVGIAMISLRLILNRNALLKSRSRPELNRTGSVTRSSMIRLMTTNSTR